MLLGRAFFAEFETNLRRERQLIARAKVAGVYEGRKGRRLIDTFGG